MPRPNWRDSNERLARVMLLRSAYPLCCDPDHKLVGEIMPGLDLLNWVRYGDGWGTIWISRIGGDSANGYEYTCTQCVDRHDDEIDELQAEYEAEEQRKWEERYTATEIMTALNSIGDES